MPKKCFVPKCNSGYKTCKEKVSLFRVPGNDTLFKQWRDAIGREDRAISRKDHICEKHFQESDIVRFWIYKDIKDKLKIPRLKKTAVPSIFPSKEITTDDNVIKTKPKKPRKRKKKEVKVDQDVLLDDTVKPEDLIFISPSDLFNKLWDNELILTVPTLSWAIHKVENCTSRSLVISDVIMADNVPCYHKQIIMNDDGVINIIIGTSIITQEEQIKYFGSPVGLNSLEDLNILISSLHILNFTLEEVDIVDESCDILN